MQSQPTAVPQNEPVESLSSPSTSSAQYGLWQDSKPSSSPSLSREAGGDSPRQSGDNDALSVSSSGSGRGRKPNIRRLKSEDRFSEGGSPVGRIEQYERSQLSSPRKGGDLSFQVIPLAAGIKCRVSVNQFPNGKPILIPLCSVLIVCRGHDPYSLVPATSDIVSHESGLQALSSHDNNTPRLEDGIFSLFPRSRYSR